MCGGTRQHGFRIAAGLLALVLAGPAWSEEPTTAEQLTRDRRLADAIKDVVNRGAALYNSGDQNGCYRLFEGALLTVRPQLDGRPDLQKKLADGLRDAEQHQLVGNRAWALYELLLAARDDINPAKKGRPSVAEERRKPLAMPPPPPPPPPEGRPEPKPAAEPPARKPAEPSSPATPPKPPAAKAPEPKPPEKKDEQPTGTVTGTVTLDRKPLADVEVRFVPVDDLKAKGYSGLTDKDGTYELLNVKRGRYRVIVIPGEKKVAIPGRYSALESSILQNYVKQRSNNIDFNLKSD
jgi:hypothetical protein